MKNVLLLGLCVSMPARHKLCWLSHKAIVACASCISSTAPCTSFEVPWTKHHVCLLQLVSVCESDGDAIVCELGLGLNALQLVHLVHRLSGHCTRPLTIQEVALKRHQPLHRHPSHIPRGTTGRFLKVKEACVVEVLACQACQAHAISETPVSDRNVYQGQCSSLCPGHSALRTFHWLLYWEDQLPFHVTSLFTSHSKI